MGCVSDDPECASDEKPAHRVRVSRGFWLGQSEVTESAYARLIGPNPNPYQTRSEGFKIPDTLWTYQSGPQWPESVNWHGAHAYCTAAGGRLPTEAEWEYAVRAGSHAVRYGELDLIAQYQGNTVLTSEPLIRRKRPNDWGLYDMLGNECEWVSDWYDPQYYSELPAVAVDPRGPDRSSVLASGRTSSVEGPRAFHATRGGGIMSPARFVRASARGCTIQTVGPPFSPLGAAVGFRCVLEGTP